MQYSIPVHTGTSGRSYPLDEITHTCYIKKKKKKKKKKSINSESAQLVHAHSTAQKTHYLPGNHHASHILRMSYFQVKSTDDPSL